ncbi:MAG: 1-acyl-sn-glycerol-3-phosphate acyltransferase [Bdellovibrionales bacterium]|nr:1-acyl-sn-glycerol-3-phosphate acyltransferase [Bdellovibrionales bacterium]
MLVHLLPDRLAKVLFGSFEAKDAFLNQVNDLRARYPDRPIAFTVLGGGFLDFWAMRFFLNERFGKEFDLRTSSRVSPFLVEKPINLYKRVASKVFLSSKPRSRIRQCSDELLDKRPVLLNLEYTDRKKAFEVPEGEKELAYLAQKIPDLLVVPVVLVWRRKRTTPKNSPTDLSHKLIRGLLTPLRFPKDFLLGDPMHPTGIRKLAILLRRYGRSTLRLTTPIAIDSGTVKAIRRRIITQIQQEKKVILGPTLTPPKFIGESILRHASFRRTIHTLAAEQEVSEVSLLKKAEKYFKEISADFSYFTIEAFAWILSLVFSRIFTGLNLDEEELEKLRLTAKEGPLLFIPCHKSYFDFMLLSYVLFRKEIAPPHIAAGINLNFWPFGHFAKGAGAFFIRRSFRGNVIYSEVLRRYIAALLQGRNNVEFFIEGARSRNGKLAPPKYGILKMIVDSHYDGLIQEKVRIVPVSINYERVTEARAHKRELEGGEKVQESFVNLFKSSKVLLRKFGEVYIRFADPLPMEEWLHEYVGDADSSQEARKLGVQKLAFEVCHRINRASPISSAGIVCAILLAKPGAAMTRAEFDTWLAKIQDDLLRMRVLMKPSLEKDFIRGCRRALAGLIEDKIVEKYQSPSGKMGLRVPEKQRIAALYYKNSCIHALLNPAVAGLAGGETEDLLELRSLLQWEFFFSEKELFLQAILHVPPTAMTRLYALFLADVLENIHIGLTALADMQNLSTEERDWKSRLMKFGKAAILEASVTRLEAVNTQSFGAFVDMAKNKKWLLPAAKDGQWKAAPRAELAKALDKVRRFRDRLPSWDEVHAQYLTGPLQEDNESSADA